MGTPNRLCDEERKKARECAWRRRMAMAEGLRMSQEAAAYHAAHVRGSLPRAGDAGSPGDTTTRVDSMLKKR